uniref:RBR-type E3 ubiquitin transferase n=1 Tax=Heterorhabditis bacteriophora TaxID=37862 RepID=A0A1I7WZ47_HETBA
MRSLACLHSFCITCWRSHIEAKIAEGVASRLECMDPSCCLLCPSEFVLRILDKAHFRARYERFIFRDYVTSHPQLKFCVGKDCQSVIRSKEKKPKRVTCSICDASFCVTCGVDYHAPTSCETIKQWLLKCADDSETANYIRNVRFHFYIYIFKTGKHMAYTYPFAYFMENGARKELWQVPVGRPSRDNPSASDNPR